MKTETPDYVLVKDYATLKEADLIRAIHAHLGGQGYPTDTPVGISLIDTPVGISLIVNCMSQMNSEEGMKACITEHIEETSLALSDKVAYTKGEIPQAKDLYDFVVKESKTQMAQLSSFIIPW